MLIFSKNFILEKEKNRKMRKRLVVSRITFRKTFFKSSESFPQVKWKIIFYNTVSFLLNFLLIHTSLKVAWYKPVKGLRGVVFTSVQSCLVYPVCGWHRINIALNSTPGKATKKHSAQCFFTSSIVGGRVYIVYIFINYLNLINSTFYFSFSYSGDYTI